MKTPNHPMKGHSMCPLKYNKNINLGYLSLFFLDSVSLLEKRHFKNIEIKLVKLNLYIKICIF
jgi:hypothetical protein